MESKLFSVTNYALLDPLLNTKPQLKHSQLPFCTCLFLQMLFPLSWMYRWLCSTSALHTATPCPSRPSCWITEGPHSSSVPWLYFFHHDASSCTVVQLCGSPPSLSPVLSEEGRWFYFFSLSQYQIILDKYMLNDWMNGNYCGTHRAFPPNLWNNINAPKTFHICQTVGTQ